MHRSPLASLTFLLLSAALGLAQANPPSPDPKQGSGLPQTPTSGTQAGSPSTAPTPTDTKSGATVTAPAASPSTSPSTGNKQPSNTPANSGATSAAPSSTDQRKANSQQSVPAQQQNVVAPPPPPAQPKTDILDSSATSGALTTDGHDPILDPAPVPQTTTTLVGGTITAVDPIPNPLSLPVFRRALLPPP